MLVHLLHIDIERAEGGRETAQRIRGKAQEKRGREAGRDGAKDEEPQGDRKGD